MGYYARLKHGSRYIELDDEAPFYLGASFVPPAPNPVPLFSGGNMLNQYSGGELKYKKYNDRSMSLPLRISANSVTETHQAARRLASIILTSLNDKSEKLYFVNGESDAIPY